MRSGNINNFKENDRLYFTWNRGICWWCGRNHADCLHHIFGRGQRGDNIHSSILNAAPLNNCSCHLDKNLKDKDTRKKFLELTLQFLIRQGYKLKDRDNNFLKKYAEYYTDVKI